MKPPCIQPNNYAGVKILSGLNGTELTNGQRVWSMDLMVSVQKAPHLLGSDGRVGVVSPTNPNGQEAI